MEQRKLEERLLNQSINFPKSTKEIITNEVVKKLGLKSKFQLNDRYDGMSFLDKHIRRVMSCMLVEKCLGIELCDKEKPLKCNSEFEYKNKSFMIIFNNNVGRINFQNNEFDFLIYVKGDIEYNRFFIEKIISIESFIEMNVINKTTLGSKKLISIDSSILEF